MPWLGSFGWLSNARDEAIAYLLRDDFTTALAAGAVNGTAAEPGPGGNRAATDANSKLTIASGLLTFATGGSAVGNPGVWWDIKTRTAGRILMAEVTPADVDGNVIFGFDATQAGAILDAINFAALGVINAIPNGGTAIPVGVYTATSYQIAVLMRDTGNYYFVKGGAFTYWTLLWASAAGTGNGYPGIGALNTTSVFTSNWVRIPDKLGLPAPVASDSFNRADGAIGTTDGAGHAESSGVGSGGSGKAYTGATWTISTNKAINTPVPGEEKAVNGTFDDADDWTLATFTIGSGTLNITAGTAGTAQNTGMAQIADHTWIRISGDFVHTAGTAGFGIRFGSPTYGYTGAIDGAHVACGYSIGGTKKLYITAASTISGTVDNVSCKILTLSELFSSLAVSTVDVMASVDYTCADITRIPGGLVLNLDSADTPLNFVVAYYQAGVVFLDKCVNGVYANVLLSAKTYAAGATIRVVKRGTGYQVFYNNVSCGTGTVADAGIVNNTIHGLFSTDPIVTLDNLVIYPSGTAGEHESFF